MVSVTMASTVTYSTVAVASQLHDGHRLAIHTKRTLVAVPSWQCTTLRRQCLLTHNAHRASPRSTCTQELIVLAQTLAALDSKSLAPKQRMLTISSRVLARPLAR
jgi:hypothetical protein